MPAKKTPKVARAKSSPAQLYTLDVWILSGMMTRKFIKKNKIVCRTIQIRSDQTLADLHECIFDAFDRFDPHLYEFQFGKGPHDRDAPRYGPEMPDDGFFDKEDKHVGIAEQTSLGSLGLKVGRSFGYWFDFGDDWMHQIDVVAIDNDVPKGKYPKVVKRVGESPPQYLEEEDWDE